MRLSMWILADWLKEYTPEAHVTQGGRTLRNARIFSRDWEPEADIVCLEPAGPGLIRCFNGEDQLLLHTEDLSAAINKLLDAFDYYNDWMVEAYQMIQDGCAMGALLDFCRKLTRRDLILADSTFYIREYALEDPARPPLRMLEDRLPSLDALLEIVRIPHLRDPDQPTYPADVTELPPAALSNLFCGARHKGWLISLKPDGHYTQGELDVQDALAYVITSRLAVLPEWDVRVERSGILLDLLEGRETPSLEERMRAFGWLPEDEKRAYLIRSVQPEGEGPRIAERLLERMDPSGFPVAMEKRLLYVVNLRLTPPEPLEKALGELLDRCGSVAGRSPVFTQLTRLPDYTRAAMVSADFAEDIPGTISSFESTELPYVSSLLRTHSVIDLTHPALNTLRNYDRKHGAAFTETLRVFLRKNCSYAETAAALFIHRSTLLYRLQRIRELCGLDLEDYDTRFQLEISFLISP